MALTSPLRLSSVFSSHVYAPEQLLVLRGGLLGGRELLLQILRSGGPRAADERASAPQRRHNQTPSLFMDLSSLTVLATFVVMFHLERRRHRERLRGLRADCPARHAERLRGDGHDAAADHQVRQRDAERLAPPV